MRAVATTVVRESVYGKQETGFIYDVDLDTGEVVCRVPVPAPVQPASDANPRGGIRGGRGVAFTPSGVVVATYDTLVRYGDDWEILEVHESPLFAGLHEIDWDGEALWVTATAIDALLRVAPDGSVRVAWDPHADAGPLLGLPPRERTLSGASSGAVSRVDHCHVNGVTRRGRAVVVHLGLVRPRRTLGARVSRRLGFAAPGESLVVRLNGSAQPEILVRIAGGNVPTHNGQFVDGTRIAINDSSSNTLRLYSAETGSPLRSFPIPGTWLRGLEPLPAGRVLVGSAPAALHLVSLESGEIERSVVLSKDPNEAVHGLAVAPRQESR